MLPEDEDDYDRNVAIMIWNKLRDRSGFDFEIDPDIEQEIINDMASTIRDTR